MDYRVTNICQANLNKFISSIFHLFFMQDCVLKIIQFNVQKVSVCSFTKSIDAFHYNLFTRGACACSLTCIHPHKDDYPVFVYMCR